jgi:hypothetical protein
MDFIKIIFFFTLGFIINIFLNNFNTKTLEGFNLYELKGNENQIKIVFKILFISDNLITSNYGDKLENLIFTGEIISSDKNPYGSTYVISNFSSESNSRIGNIFINMKLSTNKMGELVIMKPGQTSDNNTLKLQTEQKAINISDDISMYGDGNILSNEFTVGEIIELENIIVFNSDENTVNSKYIIIEILGNQNTTKVTKEMIKKYIYSSLIDYDETFKV